MLRYLYRQVVCLFVLEFCPCVSGGLLTTELEERAFRYAVDYVNDNDIIGHGINVEYVVNLTDYTETTENVQLGEYANVSSEHDVEPH